MSIGGWNRKKNQPRKRKIDPSAVQHLFLYLTLAGRTSRASHTIRFWDHRRRAALLWSNPRRTEKGGRRRVPRQRVGGVIECRLCMDYGWSWTLFHHWSCWNHKVFRTSGSIWTLSNTCIWTFCLPGGRVFSSWIETFFDLLGYSKYTAPISDLSTPSVSGEFSF